MIVKSSLVFIGLKLSLFTEEYLKLVRFSNFNDILAIFKNLIYQGRFVRKKL